MLLPCLLLSVLAQSKDAPVWTESRFHRVHLRNGNFVDGDLVRQSAREVVLRLGSGEMGIRRDLIVRVELVKMRGIQEKPEEVEAPKPAPTRFEAAGVKAPPPSPDRKPSAVAPRARAEGAYKASPQLKAQVDPVLEKLERADPEMVEPLVQQLVQMEPEAHAYLASQMEAASRTLVPLLGTVLSRTRSPAAAPYLARLLGHDNAQVRLQAVVALATNGDSSDASALRPALKDVDPAVRASGIATLAALGDEDAFDDIAPLCVDRDRETRTQALSAMTSLSAKFDLKDRLVRALSDAAGSAPPAALADLIGALGATAHPDASPALARQLDHDRAEIRAAVAEALASTGGPEATEAVAARLSREEDPAARVALAGAAARLKAVDGLESLAAWLDDENEIVKRAAHDALRAISKTDVGPDRAKWDEWIEKNGRKN